MDYGEYFKENPFHQNLGINPEDYGQLDKKIIRENYYSVDPEMNTPFSAELKTSSDGTSWDNRTSGTSNNLTYLTYSNSTFVAVGSSCTILTSLDGTTWSSRTSGTSVQLHEICF